MQDSAIVHVVDRQTHLYGPVEDLLLFELPAVGASDSVVHVAL